MPLTLVKPRPGKTPNWGIRGTIRAGNKSRYIAETTGVADRKLAEEIRLKREAQIYDELIRGDRPRHTFAEAAVGYVESVQPQATQRDAVIGKLRRDGTLSGCLISDFGNRLVDTINQEAVDQIIRHRFRGKKPATIQRWLYTPLTAVLNWAAKRKWCERPNFDRPKYNNRRYRWASAEEAARLVGAASPHVKPLLIFLLLTGARIGEAVKLNWEDVDLNDRWLVFRNTKRNKRGLNSQGENRGVPIHLQLVKELANLPGERIGPVFRTLKGQPYREHDYGGGQIKTAWRGACRRAGIEDFKPHDLRHTCATWLTMAGVHEQVRDEIIGHKSTDMGRRYSHVPRTLLLEAIDKLPAVDLPSTLLLEDPRKIRGTAQRLPQNH